MTDTTAKYLIVNRNPEPLTVILEPWAEEVILSSDSSLLLTALCDREGLLEVATDPNYLTVGLWTGCRVTLAVNGEKLTLPSLLVPSP
jgi:hypothetical protein